jgi:large subunit ribosomal protein L40e
MQIFIKGVDNKISTLDIDEKDTILDIKKKIEIKQHIPHQFQRLSYATKFLQNDKIISFYNIERECTLYLSVYFIPKINKPKIIKVTYCDEKNIEYDFELTINDNLLTILCANENSKDLKICIDS